jgi:predicted DsbA family dithiol-disulfide isomerase/uncharacterized membrane protein
MVVASIMTIQHYFAANFPESIFEGSFCDINAFFNCNSSAYSVIAAVAGVPLGYFGVMVGGLVMLGVLLPSPALERTNKTIALLNGVGVVALLGYSVFGLGSLCLLCSGYYLFSLLSLVLFWRHGIDGEQPSLVARFGRPSVRHLAAFGIITLAGAYGFARFHEAKREAQSGGVGVRMVEQYYSLPLVPWPSFISPYMKAQSTERFQDAPIQIVEYVDFLCSDCLYMNEQLDRLAEEFAGKINIAFQFFPLEAKCNQVVDKNLHPGACEASYLAAYDPAKFRAIHDEIFANFRAARTPEWRADLARRHGVEAAVTDSATIAMVHRILNTGAEYEKTDERYEHGIRSTPTLIVNNRMVIGTFPAEQLRAIFRALIDEHEQGEDRRFLENWVGD